MQQAPFEKLLLWFDPEPRPGPENMAIDTCLLETSAGRGPLLRVYHWQPDWASLGYFQSLAAARRTMPDASLHWVRRPSGGGLVDHRRDWTYTVVIPRGHPLAESRGADSYRAIHAALAGALAEEGIEARLHGASVPSRGGDCFAQVVEHDLESAAGIKLAGAGQRRSRHGLLHQGSVSTPDTGGIGQRARRLAQQLSLSTSDIDGATSLDGLRIAMFTEQHRSRNWLERRP